MNELSEIKKITEELKYNYSNSMLLGLGKVTEKQLNFLEKKTKSAIRSFQRTEFINRENSYIVSLYAVYFAKYIYDGNRFWENLSLNLRLD